LIAFCLQETVSFEVQFLLSPETKSTHATRDDDFSFYAVLPPDSL